MKIIKPVFLTVAALVFMAGCLASGEESPLELSEEDPGTAVIEKASGDAIRRLEETIAEKNEKIEILEESNRQYAEFIEAASEHLDEEEIKSLGRRKRRYTLTLNGEVYEEGQAVTLSAGPVEVKVTSLMLLDINLPQRLEMAGSLTGSVDEHISFGKEEPEDLAVTDGTSVQAFIYTFSKEKPLERLTIYLSDELKDHLGLNENEIEISLEK